ncbi:porin [Cupriavidus sp. CP313]
MAVKRAAFASLLAFTATAWAQSSITLYGVADTAVEFVNHVGAVPTAANRFNPGPSEKVYRMNSGALSGSRWGLRGEEGLGGGLKSVFVLESGFNVDTGTSQQGGRMFGRQAYVGLQSQYGQVTFGRQYTSIFDTMANFVPAAYATQYEPSVILLGPNFREDNTVKYKGTFGPVSMSAHWSFGTGLTIPQSGPLGSAFGGGGEIPGQFRRDTAYGAGVTYVAGAFGIGAAYDQYNPTIGTGSGTFKNAAIAASYAFGAAKVMGGYRWGQNRSQNDVVIKRDDFYFIGGNYQVTPAFGLTVEYDYDNVKSAFGSTSVPNPWQIALIGTYTLSKRTDVYLTTAFAKNAGLTLDSAVNGYASSLALGNSYALANGQSTMFGAAMGIRHRF